MHMIITISNTNRLKIIFAKTYTGLCKDIYYNTVIIDLI